MHLVIWRLVILKALGRRAREDLCSQTQLSGVSKLKRSLKQNLKVFYMLDKLMCQAVMSHRNGSKGWEGFKVTVTDA